MGRKNSNFDGYEIERDSRKNESNHLIMFMLNWNRKNVWKSWILLLLMIGGLTSAVYPEHALYIGVVQIIYEEENTETKIQVKVFSDDLQSVLQNELGYEQVPSIEALCANTSLPIEAYFKKQLTVKANKIPIDFTLIDCEQINDVHLITFKTSKVSDWQVCSIDASFFMELFPLQSNIINFKYIPTNAIPSQKMGRLTKGNTTIEFNL